MITETHFSLSIRNVDDTKPQMPDDFGKNLSADRWILTEVGRQKLLLSRIAIVFYVAFILPSALQAAQISVVGRKFIIISGEIVKGDADKFVKIAVTAPSEGRLSALL